MYLLRVFVSLGTRYTFQEITKLNLILKRDLSLLILASLPLSEYHHTKDLGNECLSHMVMLPRTLQE